MPRITFEDEDTIFVIDKSITRSAGELNIDGLELASELAMAGFNESNDPTPNDVAAAVKKCAWPVQNMQNMTVPQLNAIGVRVLNRITALGNSQGGPPSSLPSMAPKSTSTNGATVPAAS